MQDHLTASRWRISLGTREQLASDYEKTVQMNLFERAQQEIRTFINCIRGDCITFQLKCFEAYLLMESKMKFLVWKEGFNCKLWYLVLQLYSLCPYISIRYFSFFFSITLQSCTYRSCTKWRFWFVFKFVKNDISSLTKFYLFILERFLKFDLYI